MFFSVFLSFFFVGLYTLIFYLSANTPLATASINEILSILGLITSISFSLAILFSIASSFLFRTFSSDNNHNHKFFIKIITIIILFSGFLLLIENWSYSVFKIGLKTDNSALLKVIFLCIAGYLAHQFSAGIKIFSKTIYKRKVLILSVIVTISLFTFFTNAVNWHSYNDVATKIEKDYLDYNVLILSSDGINASEMSIYGNPHETTPFLKSIESELMIFDSAYSNNGNTTGSITSTLNGILPITSKVVYPPDILQSDMSLKSLPRILGEHGYYRTLLGVPHYADATSQNLIGAFDSVNNSRFYSNLDILSDAIGLDGIQSWYFTNTGKDLYGVLADIFFIKELDNPFSHVQNSAIKILSDKQRIEGISKAIDDAVTTKEPFFIMSHFMGSHGGKFLTQNRTFSKKTKQTQNWMPKFYWDAILDFDNRIEKFYTQLKETGSLEKTILIIMSDHAQQYKTKHKVPLLIRLPNIKKHGRYTVNVQNIDLAPTILNILNMPIPDWMEGNSLLSPETIPEDRFIIMTSVRSAMPTKIGWIRNNIGASSFRENNVYSVIYCNYFMTSSYPITFTPSELSTRPTDSICQNKPVTEITKMAKELVEKKLH